MAPPIHKTGGLYGAAASLVLLAPSCTSSSPSLPPALGDCVPVGDGSCHVYTGGSGSPGGPSGEADGGTEEAGEDGGSCGTAHTVLSVANTTCVPCIVGTTDMPGACCQVDLLCTGNCPALVECEQTCSGTACLNCPNEVGATISDLNGYSDFASCLSSQCTPECPTLPPLTQSDF
jgi:hypothetical protein